MKGKRPPSEEDRKPAPLLIGTRLVRFVIRHYFIFPATSPAAHFLSSQTSRERRYPCTVHHSVSSRDLENVVNCSATRRGTRLLLLFADARNCNETRRLETARHS